MMKYKVYADATADLPKQLQERYHIEILPIPVTIGDRSYQSGTELGNDQFYRLMEEYDGIPVTSQITPYVFEELFQKELEEGTENLLLFLINSRGSATFGNAMNARRELYERNVEAQGRMQIHLFDGASYSAGYGYAAVVAAQKLEMGMEVEKVLSIAQDILNNSCLYFGMYTLKYAGKSGRIPSAAVFVGEALGIKPIMKIWDHEITTAGKSRGEKKLVKEIAKMAASDMETRTPYCIVYGSDCAARDEMAEEMTKKVGYPPVYQFQVGAAVAINAGPRMVGVSFEAKRKKRQKAE